MRENGRRSPARQRTQRADEEPRTDRADADVAASAADEVAHSGTRQLPLPDALEAHGHVAWAPWRCCGLDEVGRGALAGPLVAAAAILPEDIHKRLGPIARFLRDSKTVPAARRVEIAALLRRHALDLQIVVISVAEINARGMGWANREAFRRLIGHLRADEYVVDGRVRPPVTPARAGRVRCLVRADAQVPAVSAAALVAKVHRDGLMAALHEQHPVYGWATNVGYGTPAHLAALRGHGPCAEHRTAFVATALSLPQAPGTQRRKQKASGLELFAEA
jgi:ribonuclease HII